jgi:putative glutamine amidotransferase
MQILNVAVGGTLYQDLPTQVGSSIAHDDKLNRDSGNRVVPYHPILIQRGSKLHAMLEADELMVNSIHHQAVKDLAPTLTATALARDGLIEAIEAKSEQFVVGVQWHPEELSDTTPCMGRLFQTFLAAASPESGM